MRFLLLTGGLLLAATGAHADTLPNGTPIQQISASVFLLGAPAEAEPAPMTAVEEAVKVAVMPTAEMTLDEIIGKRPEVMNQPRTLADLDGPDFGDETPETAADGGVATASAAGMPAPEPRPADIDTGKTAAVNPSSAPDFGNMVLRRE